MTRPGGLSIGGKAPHISVADCRRIVGEHYFVTKDLMLGDSQRAAIARPRQLAMALAREFSGMSLPFIGHAFNRDHTTVLHSQRAVYGRARHFPESAAELEHFRKRILALSAERVAEMSTRRVTEADFLRDWAA